MRRQTLARKTLCNLKGSTRVVQAQRISNGLSEFTIVLLRRAWTRSSARNTYWPLRPCPDSDALTSYSARAILWKTNALPLLTLCECETGVAKETWTRRAQSVDVKSVRNKVGETPRSKYCMAMAHQMRADVGAEAPRDLPHLLLVQNGSSTGLSSRRTSHRLISKHCSRMIPNAD